MKITNLKWETKLFQFNSESTTTQWAALENVINTTWAVAITRTIMFVSKIYNKSNYLNGIRRHVHWCDKRLDL